MRESAEIQIVLYDVLGRKVADILNEEITPGNHKVSFDAGKLNLSSGVYFLNYTAVKHKAKLYNTTSKIVYLK